MNTLFVFFLQNSIIAINITAINSQGIRSDFKNANHPHKNPTNGQRVKKPLCISLGRGCSPALNLRSLKLRTAAYPFDWLISPLTALVNGLQDDFKHLLNNCKLRPDKKGVIDSYGFQFVHDWPTVNQPVIDAINTDFITDSIISNEWKKALPQVKEKYRRRIERFKNACLGSEKIFFFRTDDMTKEQAVYLKTFLSNKFPSLNFILIIVSHNKQSWQIDGIKNFQISAFHDPKAWKKALKQLSPEFDDIEVLQDKSYRECYPLCNHY